MCARGRVLLRAAPFGGDEHFGSERVLDLSQGMEPVLDLGGVNGDELSAPADESEDVVGLAERDGAARESDGGDVTRRGDR